MPSGSKKRRAAKHKQKQQHTQTQPPSSEKGDKNSDSGSSSSDSEKELKLSDKFSRSPRAEVVDSGIEDVEVEGKVGEDVRTVEVVDSEIQWDVKDIGIEESSAAAAVVLADVAPISISSEGVEVVEGVEETVETLLDVDSLSHEIEVKPVPVFGEDDVVELPLSHESSGFVEKYVVSELSEGQESDGVVGKDSVSELSQSHESFGGCVAEIDPVTELPQTYESGSGLVEKDSVTELPQSYESGSGDVEKDSVSEKVVESQVSGSAVVIEKDLVSEKVIESQVSGSSVVIEKESVTELPQSRETGSGGDVVENAPVGQLKQGHESGGENSDRYAEPTVGVIAERRASLWNCCGLLDVFMGSRDR